MIERTTGLVLRTHPLTETSLIVRWLTLDHGRVATVAKGARRTQSPFRGKLDLFYKCEFTFSRSRKSELHTLREVTLHETHEPLRRELSYLRQAVYAARFIEQVTETETPVPGPYYLLMALLDFLPQRPPGALPVFAFELKLLNELGLAPDLSRTKLDPAAAQAVADLTAMPWEQLASYALAETQTREIRQFLHGFLIYHLGKLPGGRADALGGAE